jgi:hypothetical protein
LNSSIKGVDVPLSENTLEQFLTHRPFLKACMIKHH